VLLVVNSGVQLYDTRKVTKAIEAAVDKAWTANDDHTLAKDDANRRFKVDIFTSRGRTATHPCQQGRC
jgi:hypothetical protein